MNSGNFDITVVILLIWCDVIYFFKKKKKKKLAVKYSHLNFMKDVMLM